MQSVQIIYTINLFCLVLMVVLTIIILAGTKMKGGVGYAAIISIATTLPVYLSNFMRSISEGEGIWYEFSYYSAITINALLLPAVLFFVRSRAKPILYSYGMLLHAIPAFVSLSFALWYYRGMSFAEFEAEQLLLEGGNENLPALVNDVIVFGQFFIYFYLIYRFINTLKKTRYNTPPHTIQKWVTDYIKLFFILFCIVFIAYAVDPRTDTWLIPILNTILIIYLTSVAIHNHHSSSSLGEKASPPRLSAETVERRY